MLAESEILQDEKVVLFAGRMTLQKGPEYFLKSAKKVFFRVRIKGKRIWENSLQSFAN